MSDTIRCIHCNVRVVWDEDELLWIDPEDYDKQWHCPTANDFHEGEEIAVQPTKLIDVIRPEPNPALELRTFTTLQGRKPRWRRRYCRVCHSAGDWQDSLLLAIVDINSHPTHGG